MRRNTLWIGAVLTLVVLMLVASCGPAPTLQVIRETVALEVPVEVETVVTATPEPEKQAKYIFLFIGDGMGVAQRNAAELYKGAVAGTERPEDTTSLMNSFPAQGMNTTYDLTSVIPDSASTGTALASGHKTTSGVVGMDSDGKVSYETISESAKAKGWKVGVVSTVSIDHATPAAFYAHQPTRGNYREIGEALANSDFDYFAGGQLKRPDKSSDGKTEGLPDLYGMAEENGFTVAMGKAELDALKPGVGRVFAVPSYKADGNAMYYAIDDIPENDISIADFTRKGIELLDNPDGFFLMVEGGKIDWACHANDAAASIHDTLALDEAVAEAYEFYEAHPDETLIVVTADHETGGMTIGFAGTKYSSFVDRIQYQNISYVEFGAQIAAWRESGDTKFEDTWPVVEEHFGLIVLTDDEYADLHAEAEEGDEAAAERLEVALSTLERDILEDGFNQSMLGQEERATDDYTYLLYGGYEPMAIKLTTILNQKAGSSWTTYSHTGVPVQTSAVGVGAELFNGYYDQTGIHARMMVIAGFASPDTLAMASD
jgi:alkaline phosphatase